MDLHPIFVHFPIALLTFYSLLELCSFWKAGRSTSVFHIKLFLLVTGSLMSVITLGTGLVTAEKFEGTDMEKLVWTHKIFAISTMILYWVITAAYATRFAGMNGKQIWQPLRAAADFITHPVVSKILAVVAMGLLSGVGALGGAIVYGPESDPAVKFFYDMLIGAGQ